MSAYTVRVELKGDPSEEDYENLHKLMKKLGYGRTVTGKQERDLPHATYYGESSSSASDVSETVCKRVQEEIQNKILVFVAKTETWALGW